MKKILLFILSLGIFYTFTQAKNLEQEQNTSSNLVSVSIAPQAFFVKKIAANTLDVLFLKMKEFLLTMQAMAF